MPAPETERTVFAYNGYRYEVVFTQVDHLDYGKLLVAWRQSESTGKRSQVVLKPVPVPPDGEGRARAWEELQLATHLKNDCIARVHTVAVAPDETVYVVSENMPGMYLMTAMDWALLLNHPLSPAFIAFVGARVAEALVYAHALKDPADGRELHIVHRAVSPMMIRLGLDGRVKLTNFGSAFSELLSRVPTPPGVMRGDAAYAAPEVWRAVMSQGSGRAAPLNGRRVDARADVFSLGLVIAEAALGEHAMDPANERPVKPRPPLIAGVKTERSTWIDPGVLAERVIRFDVDAFASRLGSLPKGLRDVIRGALAADPEDRLSAEKMRADLLVYLGNLTPSYDEAAMGRELKALSDVVRKVERFLANTVERTALTFRDGDA